jgi:hypothetical protein
MPVLSNVRYNTESQGKGSIRQNTPNKEATTLDDDLSRVL